MKKQNKEIKEQIKKRKINKESKIKGSKIKTKLKNNFLNFILCR
jgi:hypothetical protein